MFNCLSVNDSIIRQWVKNVAQFDATLSSKLIKTTKCYLLFGNLNKLHELS
jgi:hypothetical protein